MRKIGDFCIAAEPQVMYLCSVIDARNGSQVRRHNKEGDSWVSIGGSVYDVTTYMHRHPGGKALIARNAGGDATADFEGMFHSRKAREILAGLRVGRLVGGPARENSDVARMQVERPSRHVVARVVSVDRVNPDSFRLRLAPGMPSNGSDWPRVTLGCHVDLCLSAPNGQAVPPSRPYTPVSSSESHIEFIIKEYKNGRVSTKLAALRPGARLLVSQPRASYPKLNPRQYRGFLIVAAGTGVAPALQLARALAAAPEKNKISAEALVAQPSTKHALLRKELEEALPLRVTHFFSQEDKKSGVGRLDGANVRAALDRISVKSPGSKPILVFSCGPPSFSEFVGRSARAWQGGSVAECALRANPTGRRRQSEKIPSRSIKDSKTDKDASEKLNVQITIASPPPAVQVPSGSAASSSEVTKKPFLAPAPRVRRGKKVPLKPGHSQLDWMRRMAKTVAVKPRKITREEVQKHASRGDLWMVLGKFVYDVTPYVDFHPGGVEELLRGAGRDASELFNAVHPWVNAPAMLSKCLVGMLV